MTEAYPLAWPDGWPRTPTHRQDRGYQFKSLDYATGQKRLIGFATARDKLYEELKKLGAKAVVVSSNHPADAKGVPVESRRSVGDPAVAIYFRLNDRPMSMACDRFDNSAANMRSLGLAIDAMRQLQRHGGGHMMERAFKGFAELPPPDQRQPVAVEWRVELGPIPDGLDVADQLVIAESRYRQKAKAAHSDTTGGDDSKMIRLNAAIDLARKELGA